MGTTTELSNRFLDKSFEGQSIIILFNLQIMFYDVGYGTARTV